MCPSEDFKKSIDPGEVSANKKESLDALDEISKAASTCGLFCTNAIESIPDYNRAPCEKVYNAGNSSIVLGKDRPRSRASGHGGKGHTQCFSIDMVVGRMGHAPLSVGEDGKPIKVDPNYFTDAARIVISQKTAIDDNFKLAPGSIGKPKPRSGIGIKADQVRIIAREGIKLVTGTDKINSQGAEVKELTGIDIIAGNNDTTLEPMVKGKALVNCLETMRQMIEQLNGIVDSILTAQMNMNSALTNHFHNSPFFALPTTPSFTVVLAGQKCMMDFLMTSKADLMKQRLNLAMLRQNYLTQAGKGYIGSRYNNVN